MNFNNIKFDVPVFRPSMDEFKDFAKYIDYIESTGANKIGLAKVIPPREWSPRKGGYDDLKLQIKSPIKQQIRGSNGVFQQFVTHYKKSMRIQDFQAESQSDHYRTPVHTNFAELEEKYWNCLSMNADAIYGADVSGTLFDKDQLFWNLNNLGTILDDIDEVIQGVNTSYLYFGMWKSTFAWHTEDMDLYSINFLHFGEPKSWYIISPENGKRFEEIASRLYPESAGICKAFLRHKISIISPSTLEKYSIPFAKETQEAGEFMITFPYAYHSGYNHGFNCAEAINFAMNQWISYGKKATMCVCKNSNFVKLNMDIFTRKYESGDLRNNAFCFNVNYNKYSQFTYWAQKYLRKIQNQTTTWINKIASFEKTLEHYLLKTKELKDEAVQSNICNGKVTNLNKLRKKSTRVGKEHVYIQRTAPCQCNVIYYICFPYHIDKQDVAGDKIQISARRENWHQPYCQLFN
jgi:hypothetical protein